ncbi:MAG: radical SAM protein [Candidatus Bathyarchaeota archaeon]|nr:radical SAM protein [Candidatus Bathyarchaeota archaeon]
MAGVFLAKLETKQSMRERRKFAPPFGILYLANALEKGGFKVILIHEEGTEKEIEKLVRLVLTEKPIWVGFSTMTGPTILPCLKASRMIKNKTEIPVVWGGIHPTIVPEQTLMNDSIDIVVIGEGEETAVELTKVLKSSVWDTQQLSKVAGIGFKKDGQLFFTLPRSFIKNLNGYSPSWRHLDMTKYIYSGDYFQYSKSGGNKIMAFITSRGCPWRCGYCYNQAVNKRTFRAHSVEKIVSQIRDFKERHELTGVRFWDDNIFTNKSRALKIFQNIRLPWISSIRANEIVAGGEDFVRELSQTNCKELNMGVESGSQRMLNLMKKDINLNQVRWAARMCGKYRIKLCLGFMVGLPGETWSDICETLQFMEELERMNEYVIIRGLAIFTPLPKTPLFDLAIKMGFKPPNSLKEWSKYEMGYVRQLPSYADNRIESMGYYLGLANRNDLHKPAFPYLVNGLQKIARFRIKHRFFYFPLDHTIPAYCRRLFERLGLAALTETLYRR